MMFKYFWFCMLISALGVGCSFTQKIHTGKQAYDVKQFAVATQLFEKEYADSRTAQEKAYLAFFAGESYTRLNDPSSAAEWYHHAFTDGFGVDALDRYAGALKQQEKYQEAIQAYEELLKMVPNHAGYRANITLCKQAIDWKKNSNPAYEIASVAFNSPSADYAPQPIGRGVVMFTSDRDSREHTNSYLWTGRAFSDLYVSNATQGSVTPFDAKINSPDNEGTAVISPDGNVLIFTRCYVDKVYDAWCKLMISYRRGNAWSDPQT
jgi:peptidoglycan-associated lipoprotein